MKILKPVLLLVLLTLFSTTAFSQYVPVTATSPEQSGDSKMASGDFAGAVKDYSQQWISWMAGKAEDDPETQKNRERLAEKLSKAIAKLSALPAVSDDTKLHAQKGAAFVKLAKSQAEFEKAVAEFQEAVNLAPWNYNYQFNLSVALKSAGHLKTALGFAKVAKLLAQNDNERDDAIALRAEIEAAGEIAVSAAANAAAEESAIKNRPRAIVQFLEQKFGGRIIVGQQICHGRPVVTCNDSEAQGSTWTQGARDGTYSWTPILTSSGNIDWSSRGYKFNFRVDSGNPNQIIISWADDGKEWLRGTVNGPDLRDVAWREPGSGTPLELRVYTGEGSTQIIEKMVGCDSSRNCFRERWLFR